MIFRLFFLLWIVDFVFLWCNDNRCKPFINRCWLLRLPVRNISFPHNFIFRSFFKFEALLWGFYSDDLRRLRTNLSLPLILILLILNLNRTLIIKNWIFCEIVLNPRLLRTRQILIDFISFIFFFGVIINSIQ